MKNVLSVKVDIHKAKVNSKGESQIYIYLNSTINSKRIRKQIFTGYNICSKRTNKKCFRSRYFALQGVTNKLLNSLPSEGIFELTV